MKRVGLILLLFVTLISAGVVLLWMNPHWILNEGMLFRLSRTLETQTGVVLVWQGLKVETKKTSLLAKTLVISAKKFCVFEPKDFRGCAKPFQIEAGFALRFPLLLKGKVDLVIPRLVSLKDAEFSYWVATDRVEFHLKPQFPKFRTVDSHIKGEISGGKFSAEVKATSSQFRELSRVLSNTTYAIPEPFNGLDGDVEIFASGKGELTAKEFQIPFTAKTRLKSREQKLSLGGKGEARVKILPIGGEVNLDGEIALNDVKLVLPTLDKKGAPPRLFPDSRIRLPSETKPSTWSFNYRLKVASEEKPVYLVSNLVKKPVPISVDLETSSSERMAGRIDIEAFPVDLFNRQAKVSYFNLHFSRESEDIPINGKVRVEYSDYTIFVLVAGVAQKPQIRFFSEPPLPEDEVISVLLFGKRMEKLNSGQTGSVASARSAFTDGAVSLLSMYFLSSTPIESIGYDPATKSFSAQLRLATGTTLAIGSNLKEVGEVSIRRRLSDRWSSVLNMEHPLEPSKRSFSAFLEWAFRY